MQHLWKCKKRGKDFWAEFELYATDLLVGVVVDITLVEMLAPYTRFGQPSISRELVGRTQQTGAARRWKVEVEKGGGDIFLENKIFKGQLDIDTW